jgi:2-polyprenyl-6-methoxyphenol hydroxylase-like FAD-dependent oxidoreductase
MKIVIIGGGITGLTTALTLQKLGFSCQVYEKAPELKAVGAGIWMQPNAMKVLDWIGVGDQVRAAGQPLSRVDLTDRHLLPLKKLDRMHIQDESYNQIISIHRSRLQKVLYDALPLGSVHLGQSLLSASDRKGFRKDSFRGMTNDCRLVARSRRHPFQGQTAAVP